MVDSFNPKSDRSPTYLHYEAAASSVENAGIAYQSPSLIAVGASAQEIALLTTVTNLFFSLLLLRVPAVVKFGDSLKRATVVLGMLGVLGWIPLILVPIFFKGVSPVVLIVLWVVNLLPTLMVGPLRDKWLSDIVPSSRLGRYLSLRSVVSAGTYLSFFYVMGYMLDHFKGGIFDGFGLIFMVSFAVSLVGVVLYLVIKVAVPMGESGQSDLGLFSFVREAKQNELGVFIVFSAAIIFSASICGAFFSVYMLRDLHFSYLTYSLVISVEFLARIGISFFGGRWVDNAGAIKVLRYASIFIPFVPILWLFSSDVRYLLGIQVISGMAWATFDICTQSYLCKASSAAKRLHYIIYHRSIVTLAAALGPLLGSLLLNVMVPIFGSPILGIFLLSGVLRLAAVAVIGPRLREVNSEGVQGELEPIELERDQPTRAVLFQSALEGYAERGKKRSKLNLAKPVAEVRRGSFYHPEIWAPDLEPAANAAENVRQDLLYRDRAAPPLSYFSLAAKTPTQRVARLDRSVATLTTLQPDPRRLN